MYCPFSGLVSHSAPLWQGLLMQASSRWHKRPVQSGQVWREITSFTWRIFSFTKEQQLYASSKSNMKIYGQCPFTWSYPGTDCSISKLTNSSRQTHVPTLSPQLDISFRAEACRGQQIRRGTQENGDFLQNAKLSIYSRRYTVKLLINFYNKSHILHASCFIWHLPSPMSLYLMVRGSYASLHSQKKTGTNVMGLYYSGSFMALTFFKQVQRTF